MNFEKEPPPKLDALSEQLLAQTPLHFACYTGDGHLLDTLIGNTLLYNNNCEKAASSCVAALISEEDTINGWTPAHWAAFYGHLSCLLKLNVSPNIGFDTPSHRSNTSPLHLCAQSGSVLCLKWLLQYVPSKNRQDFMGETALHKAAKHGNMDCAYLLANHGSSLSLKNHRGLSPADLAEQFNHSALAHHLRQMEETVECATVSLPSSNLSASDKTSFNKHDGSLFTLNYHTTDAALLLQEDPNPKHSYIFMNGEVIHNSLSTESCDMDQSESETLVTNNLTADSFMNYSSWSKKRSFDEFDDILQSHKRRCFASPGQKSPQGRYGSAFNNNTISSYNAVLAMQVCPVSEKSPTESAGAIKQQRSPVLQQSSVMEHEASVVAQQGYDSSVMTNFSNAFH